MWRLVQEFRSSQVTLFSPASMALVRTWLLCPGPGSLQDTARLLKGPEENRELDSLKVFCFAKNNYDHLSPFKWSDNTRVSKQLKIDKSQSSSSLGTVSRFATYHHPEVL